MPVFALNTGPMVLPQPQSFLTTNSCTGGNFAPRASSRTIRPVIALVA
jgi:hypothetical protein